MRLPAEINTTCMLLTHAEKCTGAIIDAIWQVQQLQKVNTHGMGPQLLNCQTLKATYM